MLAAWAVDPVEITLKRTAMLFVRLRDFSFPMATNTCHWVGCIQANGRSRNFIWDVACVREHSTSLIQENSTLILPFFQGFEGVFWLAAETRFNAFQYKTKTGLEPDSVLCREEDLNLHELSLAGS